MDDNEKFVFQYILARLQNREMVMVALATIISSASLVFLSIAFEKDLEIEPFIILLGILFPTIGILNHEITYRTIHTHDHRVLQEMMGKEKCKDDRDERIFYTKHTKSRGVLMRSIFYMPIFGWIYFLDVIAVTLVVFPLLVAIILLTVCFEPNRCSDQKYE